MKTENMIQYLRNMDTNGRTYNEMRTFINTTLKQIVAINHEVK